MMENWELASNSAPGFVVSSHSFQYQPSKVTVKMHLLFETCHEHYKQAISLN